MKQTIARKINASLELVTLCVDAAYIPVVFIIYPMRAREIHEHLRSTSYKQEIIIHHKWITSRRARSFARRSLQRPAIANKAITNDRAGARE